MQHFDILLTLFQLILPMKTLLPFPRDNQQKREVALSWRRLHVHLWLDGWMDMAIAVFINTKGDVVRHKGALFYSAAIPGRCMEWIGQAPLPAKNLFSMCPPQHGGRIGQWPDKDRCSTPSQPKGGDSHILLPVLDSRSHG